MVKSLSSRFLPDQDISSQCGQEWGHLRQHSQARLETRPWHQAHTTGMLPLAVSLGLKKKGSLLQTVKCLLIYPNPESALNEEAGRLLLEQYQDYFSHAKMMTEIHARPSHLPLAPGRTEAACSGSSSSSSSSGCGPERGRATGKKRPMEKGVPLDRKKKDKKKALKRL